MHYALHSLFMRHFLYDIDPLITYLRLQTRGYVYATTMFVSEFSDSEEYDVARGDAVVSDACHRPTRRYALSSTFNATRQPFFRLAASSTIENGRHPTDISDGFSIYFMSFQQNFLKRAWTQKVVSAAPIYKPSKDEVLVKIHAAPWIRRI